MKDYLPINAYFQAQRMNIVGESFDATREPQWVRNLLVCLGVAVTQSPAVLRCVKFKVGRYQLTRDLHRYSRIHSQLLAIPR